MREDRSRATAPRLALAGALALGMGGCGEATLSTVQGDPNLLGVDLGETAVITGDYERVEEFLTEIEAPFTLYDGWISGPAEDAELIDLYGEPLATAESLLGDGEGLGDLDTLFINCGVRGSGVIDPVTVEPSTGLIGRPSALRNLRGWVQAGGELYIADQSYGLLEAAIPEAVDFWGPDTVLGAAQVGRGGRLPVEVADERLSFSEGLALSLEIGSHWAVAHSAAEGAWLTVEAPVALADGRILPVPGTPILLEVPFGSGRIYFSSVHNGVEVDPLGEEVRIQLIRAMGGAL